MCPLFLRISFVKNIITCFLSPLNESGYKSSYFETVGNIIGTILAITGTLFLQGMIDRKADKEKELKKKKDIRYRVIIVYYDLKLAFEDISKIHSLLPESTLLVNEELFDASYNKARSIEIYVDENWIRNVASLHEIFDDEKLKEIFLCYGDICSIRNGLKSGNKDKNSIDKLNELTSKFFGKAKKDSQLAKCYNDLLEYLEDEGKIEERKDIDTKKQKND